MPTPVTIEYGNYRKVNGYQQRVLVFTRTSCIVTHSIGVFRYWEVNYTTAWRNDETNGFIGNISEIFSDEIPGYFPRLESLTRIQTTINLGRPLCPGRSSFISPTNQPALGYPQAQLVSTDVRVAEREMRFAGINGTGDYEYDFDVYRRLEPMEIHLISYKEKVPRDELEHTILPPPSPSSYDARPEYEAKITTELDNSINFKLAISDEQGTGIDESSIIIYEHYSPSRSVNTETRRW